MRTPTRSFSNLSADTLSAYSVSADHVFWRHVDPPSGFYIIESEDLRVSYEFANILHDSDESTVAGTVTGRCRRFLVVYPFLRTKILVKKDFPVS